ncbi:MAG: excinuclease ABC subunit UvrA [Spirochaetota bacterium]|nr:excinuclease ABC subunit UvrA [Spirochaetota bacterium]
MDKIIIKGARQHNLKNIDIELPRDRLIIISGLSGSGKSSLAFDTIYAEGQRRYVESLSAYARQFLSRMDKPDVEYIEGLSPAISIEQKSAHRNPRSTVGTVTEIYDYLRLLWSRIGQPYCPVCGRPIQEQSVDQIIDIILSHPENTRMMLLAPVVRGKKGEHQKILDDARRAGFVRVRVDGKIYSLDDEIPMDKNRKHVIDVVVARVKIDPQSRKRIAEAVETAVEVADGMLKTITFTDEGDEERFFSQKNACPVCGISFPELQPRLFSFNNPYGACEECLGLGETLEFDPDLVIPNKTLSYNQGAIQTANPDANWFRSLFTSLAEHYGFSLDTPFEELPEDVYNVILYGSDEDIRITYVNEKRQGKYEYTSNFRGVLPELKRRYLETKSDGIKGWLEQYMSKKKCHVCDGTRLKPEVLSVYVNGKNIHQAAEMSVDEAYGFFSSLELSETERLISAQIIKEIVSRLEFMKNVGLEYLTLERKASTLSGGEAQRIRLATQIGSSLVGVLYILDEPTIGLHQRDNERLIKTLLHLRDVGNTLIVVEHDEMTLRSADYIVDLGPGAGIHGGRVTAQGTIEDILASEESLTGQYLTGRRKIVTPSVRRPGNGKKIVVYGASEHNLKNIDVEFPLGRLIAITGVSGSGKSSLMNDVLYPALKNRLGRAHQPEGAFDRIEGIEHVDKVISIDQNPIGRTPRSNPATYVGLFTPIRDLFASLPESKARGYKAGRFSFNVAGGRCEHCHGDGTIKIEMHFLSDVYVTCDVCKGKRFNKETLDIRYKGRNIHDVLEMDIEEAREFFARIPAVKRRLDTLHAVGLDYLKLGQSALTLSGGEAQRVKLSLELSKQSTGKTLYFLDEPTTGLHFEDVNKLMEVLHSLVDRGNTIVLIEHNLDVIKQADYIIDLGPEGGLNGGRLVCTGSPEEIVKARESYTGRFLVHAL